MRKVNYERFNRALEEQKLLSFINLKKDIDSIKDFIESTLKAAMESSQANIERDFKINSF